MLALTTMANDHAMSISIIPPPSCMSVAGFGCAVVKDNVEAVLPWHQILLRMAKQLLLLG
jgi:hypothetical protein